MGYCGLDSEITYKGLYCMLRTKKVTLAGILLLLVVATGALWFTPLRPSQASPAAAHASLTYDPRANGPYTVSGNSILDASGQPYIFHGVGRDGLEFLCKGDGYFDAQHLAYMGPGTNGANGPYYWYGNTIRLPLSQAIWFKGQAAYNCTAAQYQAFVKQVVDTITSLHMNVIIDLHWTDADGQAAGGSAWQMSDNVSVKFWQQIATIYGGYSNVLFELYNEPHPATAACLISGCAITGDSSYVGACKCTQTFSYQAIGMQALVSAIRAAGAKNVVVAAGLNWGYDLSQFAATPLTGSNIAYDTHPYPYTGKTAPYWDASFGNLSATAPVLSLENGEYDCNTAFMSQLLAYFDAHKIGWMGWAWFSAGSACGFPQLVTDYNGTPAPSMGTYLYNHMRGYAGAVPATPTPTPTPKPGPIGTDTFRHGNQSLWGMASDGQYWGGDANVMTMFSMSGGAGLVTNTGGASYSAVLGPRQINAEVYLTGSLSVFNNTNFGGVLRWIDGNNWYKALIDGTNLVIQRKIGGMTAILATVPFAAAAGASYSIHFRVVGTTLTANAWPSTGTEPTGWMVTATDSYLTSGYCGMRFLTQNGTATVTSFVAKSV